MKNLFKKAHKLTREMAKEYEVDYQVQFGLFLQFLLEDEEAEEEITSADKLEEELINTMNEAGDTDVEVRNYSCNKWENYGKRRTYIDMSFMYHGQSGSIKMYIDYTDEEGIFTVNQSRSGSHRFNEMKESAYQLVRDNIRNIINF